MANARKTAVRAVMRVLCDGAYSHLVSTAELAGEDLSPQDKALAAAIFFGVLERKITLDFLLAPHVKGGLKRLSPFVLNVLRAGAYQIFYMDKIPPSAAVNESVSLVKFSKERSAAGLVNAVLRGLLRDCAHTAGEAPQLPSGNSPAALSVRYSCSDEIVRSLIADYGTPFAEEYLAASFGPIPLIVRVNTLKNSAGLLLERFTKAGIKARPHAFLPHALELDFRGNIPDLPGFSEGLFHVQGAASQVACEALSPRPEERILDCCAAPGGKTATLSQMMENRGELVACDVHAARVGLIRELTDRLGVSCVSAQERDAEIFHAQTEKFDRILCDVPCSGLGILRKKPEIRYKLVTNLDKLQEIQYRILCNSVRYLKPGGFLVYSTCTLRRAENEDIVRRFLDEHAGYEPSLPDGPVFSRCMEIGGGQSHNLTLSPHIHETDGFFITSLRKL